jgi:phospholipase/carboxylesterase
MSDPFDDSPFSLDADHAGATHPVYLPRHYEPNYAYPLLVLLHGRGGDERQLLRLVPKMSERNFVAIGLRGPRRTQPRRDGTVGYCWDQAARDARIGEGTATRHRPRMPQPNESLEPLDARVGDAVHVASHRFSIHPERIYLVGYGEGATAALRLGLRVPERFAGIVALNGWLPRPVGPLMRWPDARRLRVLLLHGEHNRLVPRAAADEAHALLYSAGIDVCFHVFHTDHRLHRDMLRLVNEWVMHGVDTALQTHSELGR